MARTLEELERDSRELVNILKRTKKINLKIFERLYPDKTHFVYELLQNAEDAGAGIVRFNLSEDRLVFEHDGKRLFKLEDVEAITGIGFSSKINRDASDDDDQDYNPIGKFGVGFQAVFAYTNTPEIHSGEFHFRIEDLMVPVKVGKKQQSLAPRVTRFLFPFDHSEKTADEAAAEIEERLRHLKDNTLLFLDHIHRIEYTLPDGESGSLERIEHGNDHVEIRFEYSDEEPRSTHWLRFGKAVEVIDKNGEEKKLPIAVAYSLREREHSKKKEKTIWEIASLEPGQVFIYFPAEKETSNLRFHLHAPFSSPADRSSVVDCADNEQLRDELAKLVVESLFKIRDYGFLNVAFLAVLPNPTDDENLPPFYEPIREAIVEAFQNEQITPTKSGAYAPAAALCRGPARFSDVIKDEDVAILTGCTPPLWVANPHPLSQRQEHFLDSLEIDEWGAKELRNIFSLARYDDEKRETLVTWIIGKNDNELMRLYSLFYGVFQSTDSYSFNNQYYLASNFQIVRALSSFQIVRALSSQGVVHVKPEQAFFPPEHNIILPDDIYIVKPEVYKEGRSDSQKESARTFLEKIGVSTFHEKTFIEKIVEKYSNPPDELGNWHFDDIKNIITYWNEVGKSHIYSLSEVDFLIGISHEGKQYWCQCPKLCIDSPYIYTGLSELKEIHGLHSLSVEYEKKLSKAQLTDFINLIKQLNIVDHIKVNRVDTSDNPHVNELRQDYGYRVRWTDSAINTDYSIDNIQEYIRKHSFAASVLLWNALIRADKKSALASFRPNASYITRTAESQLVYHLRINAWIPDKQGNFRKPEDMTREELPDAFVYDDRNGLLTAIGFGKLARERDEDYQRRNENAQEFGFTSVDEAEQLKEIGQLLKQQGQSPASFLQELRSKSKPAPFPERPVSDSTRREERFAKQFADAPDKTSEKRERTVRTSKSAIDPTTWLQRNYTNDDDQMICQICKQEMPFKKRDGAPYFESREIFAGKKGKKYLSKEHEAQYLALCPVCAAKYKEFVQNDEQAMATLKDAFLATDGLEIPITLGEEQTTIRFVESHLHDFRTILKTEK